jgi:hypothetical protein
VDAGAGDLFHRQTGRRMCLPGKHPGACLSLLRLSKVAVHRPSLLLNVLAHREAAQEVRIDSRTRIPLFIVSPIRVNKKQPFRDKFIKKISCVAFQGRMENQNRRDIAAAAVPVDSKKASQPR